MSLELDRATLPDSGIDPNKVDDPYFYGWRMVPRIDAKGRNHWDQVPLTPLDILHPQEGDFIVNNDDHAIDIVYLRAAFEQIMKDRPGARVFSDHRIDWQVPGADPLCPDITVLDNVLEPWDGSIGTFPVHDMHARVLFVVEVTSPSTRDTDIGAKMERYYKAGIPLYVIVDRWKEDGEDKEEVKGYQPGKKEYVKMKVDPKKGLWLEPLQVWLNLEDGHAVCRDKQNRKIPTLKESEAEKERLKLENTDLTLRNSDLTLRNSDLAQQMSAMQAEIRRLKGE